MVKIDYEKLEKLVLLNSRKTVADDLIKPAIYGAEEILNIAVFTSNDTEEDIETQLNRENFSRLYEITLTALATHLYSSRLGTETGYGANSQDFLQALPFIVRNNIYTLRAIKERNKKQQKRATYRSYRK